MPFSGNANRREATKRLPPLPTPDENVDRVNQPIPAGISGVWVDLIGGGGGGGGGNASNSTRYGGGGGGGGGVVRRSFIPVSSLGATYSVTRGLGGAGGAKGTNANGSDGTAGGGSIFSSGSVTVTAAGGAGGKASTGPFDIGDGGAGGAVTISGVSTSNFRQSSGSAGGEAASMSDASDPGVDGSNGNNSVQGTGGGGGGGTRGSDNIQYTGAVGGSSPWATGGTYGTAGSGVPTSQPTAAMTGQPGAGGGGGAGEVTVGTTSITIVGSSYNGGTGATSFSVNKPTGTADGDILIAFYGSNAQTSGAVNYDNMTAPAGWTLLSGSDNDYPDMKIWWKIAASEGSSYSFGATSGTMQMIQIVTIRGAAHPSLWGFQLNYDGWTITTGRDCPSLTMNGKLLLCAVAASRSSTGSSSFTPPSGMTEIIDQAAAPGTLNSEFMAVAYLNNPPNPTATRTMTAANAPGRGSVNASIVIPASDATSGTGGNGGLYGGGGGGGGAAAAGGSGAIGYTRIEWAPAHTIFTLGGTGGQPTGVVDFLGGEVLKGARVHQIWYPNNKVDIDNDLQLGAKILNHKLRTTPGKKIVFAHSLGAVTVSVWLTQYGPTSDVNPDDVKFVLMGNSVRKYNGYYTLNNFLQPGAAGSQVPFITESLVRYDHNLPYQVWDFAIRHDAWADWPDDSSDPAYGDALAAVGTWNSGGSYWDPSLSVVHILYGFYPIMGPRYLFYKDGNTMYVLCNTQDVAATIAEVGYNRSEIYGPEHYTPNQPLW